MKEAYFKSQDFLENVAAVKAAEGYNVKFCSLTCNCGESFGCLIQDSDFQTVEKFILCEACYKEAAYVERGE